MEDRGGNEHSDDGGPAPRLRTPLTERLGIRHPILLAPMGDSAGGRLAAAVSDAGALGLLGGGYADPTWLARELELAAGSRIGIGFITFALDQHPETLALALDAEPVAVQLSFGDPRPHADAIRAAGAALICQVQHDDEVAQALEAGADVIVAQGSDAGGHGRPDRGTVGLVPSILDRVGEVPVVAAGGIADGRGLAGALALGTAGVSLGTRFLASDEAISTEAEAAGLLAHGSADTVRSSVIDLIRGPAWPEGHDGRLVRNDLVERWHDDPAGIAAAREELSAAYRSSAPDDHSIRALWAGEGLDLVTEILPAATIVERVVDSAVAEIRRAATFVIGSDPNEP